LADALNLRARALFYHSNHRAAVTQAQDVLKLADVHHLADPLIRVKAHRTLGMLYRTTANYLESLTNHQHEYDYAVQADDAGAQAAALLQIAELYAERKDIDHAHHYAEQATAIDLDLSDPVTIAEVYNASAAIYGNLREFDTALGFLQQAYDAANQSDNLYLQILSGSNLGTVYGGLGQFDEAGQYLLENLDKCRQLGNTRLLAVVCANLAMFYFYRPQQDLQQAEAYAHECITLSEEHDYPEQALIGYDMLAQIKVAQGDYEQAYVQREAHTERLRAYFSAEQERQLKQAEFRYQTENARREAEQLRQRNQTLVNLNQLKDSLLNTASHDLKTPISGLLLALNMLEQHGRTDDQRGQVLIQRTYNYIERMTLLINDILDFARFETGLRGNRTQRNLAPFLDELQTVFDHLLTEHNLTMTRTVFPPDLSATLEFDSLYHILQNLVSNAIKFTPAGGKIQVSATQERDNLRIDVIDTGQGISLEDQAHIFEPFFRRASDHKIEGSGLGLSIVQSLISGHGWSITVKSTPGTGTTFTVRIPLN